MKKEELKNFTPEMVEELRSLGVEFENTALHYFKGTQEYDGEDKDYGYYWWVSYELRQGRFSTTWDEEECKHSYRILPAPNLQEVLEKLPSSFQVWNDFYKNIQSFDLNINVYHTEVKFKYGIGYNSHLFYNNNLLIAAYELLKWVAFHHPETLKGGQGDENS